MWRIQSRLRCHIKPVFGKNTIRGTHSTRSPPLVAFYVEDIPNPRAVPASAQAAIADCAHVFTTRNVNDIEEITKRIQEIHNVECGVVTVGKLANAKSGADVADFARCLYDHWGIGDKETSAGMLVSMSRQGSLESAHVAPLDVLMCLLWIVRCRACSRVEGVRGTTPVQLSPIAAPPIPHAPPVLGLLHYWHTALYARRAGVLRIVERTRNHPRCIPLPSFSLRTPHTRTPHLLGCAGRADAFAHVRTQWLISTEQRYVELVTGAGVRGTLTDVWVTEMLDEVVAPVMKRDQIAEVGCRVCTQGGRACVQPH